MYVHYIFTVVVFFFFFFFTPHPSKNLDSDFLSLKTHDEMANNERVYLLPGRVFEFLEKLLYINSTAVD